MPSAISALGYEGDNRDFVAIVPADSGMEHHFEHGIQELGSGGGNFKTSGTFTVALQDIGLFTFDEARDELSPFTGGEMFTTNGF